MKQLVLKYGKYFVFSVLLMSISISCDKIQTPIPYVLVSFNINLTIANDLTVPGNSVFFPGVGYGGIVVYCELPGSYYAFDATCTYEVSRSCAIQNNGVVAECPCCESQFVLLSGAYPSKGPAEMPLKQYNVSVVNEFTLRVYN